MTPKAEKLPEAEREIDAGGKLVLPGGVDSHCHIEQLSSIGIHDAEGRELLYMAVAVDPARQDEFATGVNLARRLRQRFGQGDDPLTPNADVALHPIGGGHHRAAADDQIQIRHDVHSHYDAARLATTSARKRSSGRSWMPSSARCSTVLIR